MKETEQIDKLIAKYLSGNATPEEAMVLDNWKSESEENMAYFKLSEKTYNSILKHKSDSFDSQLAWKKLNKKITKEDAQIISIYSKNVWFKVAAVALVILTIGFWFWNQSNTNTLNSARFTSQNEIIKDTLPDGSEVVLNKNSEIQFEEKNNVRTVKLEGEAFFKVVHNENMPFEIVVKNTVIRDIGTAFNVKAPVESDDVEVAVESGIVEFKAPGSESLVLHKGDKAVYHSLTGVFEKSAFSVFENISSYQSKLFNFKNTQLIQAIRQINRVYNSRIILKDSSLGEKAVSVKFDNESVETIVNVLAETLDMSIEKKDSCIYLNRKQNNEGKID